eukprot:gene25124-28404_t
MSESIVANFPTPNTKHNRIMAFILNFNFKHIDPLLLIFNEYVSMCEGGWEPTVVLHTTVNWTSTMHRYMRQRSYCYRKGASINIRVDVHDKSVGTGLSMKHKRILQEELDNQDFFVYHEDDIIFKYSHLVGYLNETKKLHELNPESELQSSVIGFMRYRRILRTETQSNYQENDIFEQEMLEETPDMQQICVKHEPYLLLTGNTHQAIWAFTRGQLLYLQTKCKFLEQATPSREFMSSFLVFDNSDGNCGMKKYIPGARFTTFSIYHYYKQRHVGWNGLFAYDDAIYAGYNTTNRA